MYGTGQMMLVKKIRVSILAGEIHETGVGARLATARVLTNSRCPTRAVASTRPYPGLFSVRA